jgi:membrane peptidoglycan carboxypeptidase
MESEKSLQGVVYHTPPKRHHPPGWRLRRHMRRKSMRQKLLRNLAFERGIAHILFHMSISMLIPIVIFIMGLVTVTSFVEATQQRFGTDVLSLQDILPGDSLRAYDMHGRLIYETIDQGMQVSVPLSQISPHLINAEIAIEDQNFWKNPGYDINGIIRAAIDNLHNGRVVSGGSTITQQLIKNTLVGNHESILRKLQELTLAPQITNRYTKEQILTMYLNTSYYGERAYGANAAAFTYYNLQDNAKGSAASQLDLAQAAMLAGIPSAPIGRDPFLHPVDALKRMDEVLQQMYQQGYITAEQRALAFDEAKQPNFFHHGYIDNSLAPHFMHYALKELAQDLHVKVADLSRSGMVVQTTLDLPLQQQALKIAQRHIAELAVAHHMSNAAVVVIDYRTGALRTLLGNIDPNNPVDGDFDVASQGYRQPGSSYKPYIYATAFGQHISPGEPVMDGPLTIQMCCGLPSYSPLNYDLGYHGLVTYRYALQNSFNIPAVKLLMRTGIDAALQTAVNMGLSDYTGVPNYTMVLGSLSIHLLDQTSAYGAFANHGVRVPQHAIDTVRDTQGRVIFRFQDKGKQVISPQVAYVMTDVLSDNSARTFEFGKCSALYLYSNSMASCYAGNPGTIRPSAVKTGTSNEFRDNWTVGYTSDFVVGVWAGNNNNSPMVNVTGVDGAAPIWHDTLLVAERDRPIRPLQEQPPAGVAKQTVAYPGMTTTDWHIK